MTYQQNNTAIGVYRTLQGTGLGHPQQTDPGQWDEFKRTSDGWAAYDKHGATWPVTEAEAQAIIAKVGL